MNLIERGQDYCELKKSYIIFICPFDAFGRGLHKYTFEHRCLEDVSLGLGDEATMIFLCADGAADDISEEFKYALAYLLRSARHALHDIILLRTSAIRRRLNLGRRLDSHQY